MRRGVFVFVSRSHRRRKYVPKHMYLYLCFGTIIYVPVLINFRNRLVFTNTRQQIQVLISVNASLELRHSTAQLRRTQSTHARRVDCWRRSNLKTHRVVFLKGHVKQWAEECTSTLIYSVKGTPAVRHVCTVHLYSI